MREFIPLPGQVERLVALPEGRWHLERRDIPHLDDFDLLFKLLVAGIRAEDRPLGQGSVLGAMVGEIAAVGDGVTRWNPLDRALLVAETGPEGAGIADFLHASGAPDRQHGLRVFRIPEHMNAEDATLLPSAATAARILRKAKLPKGGRLLVVGLGLAGQILVLLARHQRVEQILAADSSATLRAKAEWSGATGLIRIPEESLETAVLAMTQGAGVDAAVLLTPDAALLSEASRAMRDRGSLVVAAEFPVGVTLNVAPAWIQRREILLQGVRGFRDDDLREVMRIVEQGTLNAESYVSRRTPWAELERSQLDPSYWTHGTQVLIEGPEWDVENP